MHQITIDQCASNGLYDIDDPFSSYVLQVEQKLNIDQSPDQRYENITSEILKNAANMLVYFGTCPPVTFHPWFDFFAYYFSTSIFYSDVSRHQIMLTLNRFMKIPETSNYEHLVIARTAQNILLRMLSVIAISEYE